MLPQYNIGNSNVSSRFSSSSSNSNLSASYTAINMTNYDNDNVYSTKPPSAASSLFPSNILNLTKRKLYKRYQHQIRNMGFNKGRYLILISIFIALVTFGLFFSSWFLLSNDENLIQESEPGPYVVKSQPTQYQKPTEYQIPVPPVKKPILENIKGAVIKETVMVEPIDVKKVEPEIKEPEIKEPEIKEPNHQIPNVETIQPLSKEELEFRRNSVKNAFIHAWTGYEKHAFGHDEVRPVTNATNDSWNGWGVTLVDALDTILLMGLDQFYERAKDHVSKLNFKKDHSVSFFETTIRYLGGLLGAYTLSEDQIFLDKSIELAQVLLPAFETTTGIPKHGVNVLTGEINNPTYTRGSSILAEVGTVQLEFKYLSYLTKDKIYYEKAQKAMDVLEKATKKLPGLYPLYISPETGEFTTSQISFGALADSFYEYLLKQYLQTGKVEDQFKNMYIESVEGLKKHLIENVGKKTIVAEMSNTDKVLELDHLLCFVPGMLALGATELSRPSDLDLAKKLVETCYFLYEDQVTGIGPEKVRFDRNVDKETEKPGYRILSTAYFLRPETIESIFVLYRQTKDPKYQEWGWKIFQAIEKHCKTPSAYSGLLDVTKDPSPQNNSMQSFFFAETLKYLYLLFSEDTVLPQNKYVFNTEAHPFLIYDGMN